MGARQRPITTGEYRKLINRLDEESALAVRISANTGLRVSDVLSIRVGDIKRTMTVTEGKTGKSRKVHLPVSTYKAAVRWSAGRAPDERLIDCNRATVYRHIRAVAGELGMDHVSMHSLRKYYARRYTKKHGIAKTQEELQHKYRSTTMLYVLTDEEIERLLDDKGSS